ncbi:MAG TPA: hypothetical protein VJU80_14865 [Solirubrobacteraceae bacterium]|nr:hypothetical protein [Solirubrobacteraceae bacterium]
MAIHNDPEPNAIGPGRTPIGAARTTRPLRISISATELGATRTVAAPEPASFTATTAITASSNAPAMAINAPPGNLRLAAAAELRPARRLGASSAGFVDEDRLFEFLKRSSRLESQLVEELAPSVPIGPERLGMASGSIQREHQLPAKALAQRMLVYERLEFAHQPAVLAGGEIGIDALLETSNQAGNPTPGTGDIVRIDPSGARTTIASGLTFPTGMTIGPDGDLWVSNQGFGPTIPGFGQILRINPN